MSLPICANGPVRGARKPILIGADCAGAPTGAAIGATNASSTASLTRDERVMTISPWRLTLRPERTQHAAWREQDDADVDGAEDQQPALRVHADEVLQEDDRRRAERRPRERARSSERDHEQRLDRGH